MPGHPRHPDDLAQLEDGGLVRLAHGLHAAGDAERETARRAVAVVLVRRRPLIRAVIAAKVPKTAVDDLESDVFARFAAKVYRGDPIANPAGLLVRMARFLVADFHAGRRDSELPIEEWDAGADDAALDAAAVEQAVDELLAPLSDRQREVLCQRIIGERSSAEVAALQGTTPGNIDVIVHRALARLREAAS